MYVAVIKQSVLVLNDKQYAQYISHITICVLNESIFLTQLTIMLIFMLRIFPEMLTYLV